MMQMILFILHEKSKLMEVLDSWNNVGVNGITILPSTSAGRLCAADLLRDDLPLMPSFDDLMETPEIFNRTLITIVDGDEMVDRVIEATVSVVGDLDEPNTGILSVIPLNRVYGLNRKTG